MALNLENRKILVTGASGSLAKQILFELNSRGIKPIAHIRDSSNTDYIDSLNLEKRVADLRDEKAFDSLMSGIDLVIHTAAIVNFRQDRFTQFAGVNTIAAVNLFKAAQKAGVKRFIHISSVAAVGGVKRREMNKRVVDDLFLSNEDTEYNANHLRIPYFMTKRAAEEELLKIYKEGPTELVIVNPSIIAAPREDGDDRAFYTKHFSRLIIPSNPIRVNIVDVRDVAAGTIKALEEGKNGERYILGGDNITLRELVLTMSALLGKIPHLIRFPRKFYDVTSRFWLWLMKITGRSRISYYPDLVKLLDFDWAFSNKKAHHELGYRWRSIHTTLNDLLNNNFTGTWKKRY